MKKFKNKVSKILFGISAGLLAAGLHVLLLGGVSQC